MVPSTALENIELHGEKMILASFSFQLSVKEKVSVWCYSSASVMLANFFWIRARAGLSNYIEFNYSALFPLYFFLQLLPIYSK